MWWPGIPKHIGDIVLKCLSCAQNREEPLLNYLWQMIASDLFQIRYDHYLLTVNYFSRYLSVIPYFNVSDQLDCSITGGLNHLCHRWINLYHLWSFMTSSKWRQPLNAEQLTCHNAGVVTRCLLKLLHKHHTTCALLATQKSMLDYDRKVVKRQGDHEHYHSNNTLSQYIQRMPVSVILPASVPF